MPPFILSSRMVHSRGVLFSVLQVATHCYRVGLQRVRHRSLDCVLSVHSHRYLAQFVEPLDDSLGRPALPTNPSRTLLSLSDNGRRDVTVTDDIDWPLTSSRSVDAPLGRGTRSHSSGRSRSGRRLGVNAWAASSSSLAQSPYKQRLTVK